MLLVIYCHGVLLPYHSVVGNLMMTLAWGAVPCFVMASGAVLHQSRHFTWQKHGKRLGSMYMTLVCWRLLYLVVYRIAGKITGISLWTCIKYLFFLQDYEGVDTGLMWYMIAYLGLMIVYPITYFLFTGGHTGKADYILYHDPIRSDRYPFSICELAGWTDHTWKGTAIAGME